MSKKSICIPSELSGGLQAELSESLEDSAVYNYVEIDDSFDPPVISHTSQRYSCHAVACLDPIEAIATKGAEAIIVRKIGPEYLKRFLNEGVGIFVCPPGSVKFAAIAFINEELRRLTKFDFSNISRREQI